MLAPHSTPPAKLLETFKFVRVPSTDVTSGEEKDGAQALLVATRAQLLAGQTSFIASRLVVVADARGLHFSKSHAERALSVERYNPAVVSFDALKALTGSHHATLVEVLGAHAQDHNALSLKHNPARAIFTVQLGQNVEGILVLSRSRTTQEENAAMQVMC